MDKIDKKILLCLDNNPRISFTQIGKYARISKEVAQYRYKQLIKQKILTGFFAFINTSKIGYDAHKLLVKYKSVNKEIHDEISAFLVNDKTVAWAGNCEGTWDLVITLISATKKDFQQFYYDFFNKFGEHLREKELLMPIDNPLFNDKYLSDGKLLYKKNIQFTLPQEKIDKTDSKILLEISLNSRATYTEIGNKLNLNYWTIAQRLNKLIEKQYIVCLKPRIDFRKLGYSYYHLFIDFNNEKIRKDIENYYTQHKSCIMLMNHIGKYSMHLEFVINKDEMKDVIMDFRDRFGDRILGYEPLLITDEHVMNLVK